MRDRYMIMNFDFDTVEPADSLEFCPHPEAYNIFVCGTYKLNERATAKDRDVIPLRQGHCLVFSVEDNQDAKPPSLRHIQSIDLPAIPDMKWHHTISSADPVLGVADSEGNVNILRWRFHELEQVDSVRCTTEDTLCLSLDWSNRRIPQACLSNLVVSLSNGSLCLLRPTDQGELLKTSEWRAHEYEAWIAAWDCWETNIMFSGGDDLTLKFWDIRETLDRPFFTNKRFEAGVTAIQSHPHIEHLIAVGSYNDMVYLFDRRKASIAISEVSVGGGAWRVKWNPHISRKRDLLVACMQDGFKILRYEDGLQGSQIIQRFDSHKSLAYGVDWSHQQPATDNSQIVGSCSFYDHLLHVWKA